MNFFLTIGRYAIGLMAAVLDNILNSLGSTLRQLESLLGNPTWQPRTWNEWIWGLVVLAFILIVSLLLRGANRRGARRTALTPELLISKGHIVQLDNSILQQLSFKISNLGDYSVQLLELSLQTSLMPEPVIIEAVELLAPHEAADLEAVLPTDIIGETGTLLAYAYVARNSSRMYALRASFNWEPWNKRFKISPTGQLVRPAQGLSSARIDQLRKKAWLEYNPQPHVGNTSKRAYSSRVEERRKLKKTLDLDFPNEF